MGSQEQGVTESLISAEGEEPLHKKWDTRGRSEQGCCWRGEPRRPGTGSRNPGWTSGGGGGGVTDTKNHYKCNFPANDLRERHPVRERKNPL